jgi:hypothetical protein
MHWSDCATNNGPALEDGPCDCGWAKAERVWWRKLGHLGCIRVSALRIRFRRRIEQEFRIHGRCANKGCRQTHCLLSGKPALLYGPFRQFHKCEVQLSEADRDT